MTDQPDPHRVESVAALEALYGSPSARSLLKEVDRLTPHYRAFVEASPFVLLATAGPEGLDCSPRGDAAGFVRTADDRTLLIPDRPGNNRLDSLKNIVRDPRVALLFLVPGAGETLRVNGRAEVTTDPAALSELAAHGREPRAAVRVKIERVYFQCAKALMRSRLWALEAQEAAAALPSAGEMIAALSSEPAEAGTDRGAARAPATLW